MGVIGWNWEWMSVPWCYCNRR